ncbi:PA0069 family radical SAM protein [Roseiconus nitratireducens]|uniref:PA0069 family radical SAM protein n=1 Tax=Roseiconus nitratireducens TaxID=2605748 RepID=A0A5M6D1V1_9BACT|nr:PA0069 family radical SAM protein [Roseiconus nitratireducens]KAA5541428.1 PA0069 family radical SAM protein [Roseiconus nitratireducens]
MRHGAGIDPPNRFETVHREADLEHLQWDQEHLGALGHRKIEYIADSSKSIVAENRSPDIPFRYSVNPYRGCAHGCAYCYARPSHEFLGLSAGLDFETKIIVKHDAPRLFSDFLARPSWVPEPINFSGVTDCYQPAEREFRLTRGCLEVAAECRQPISIVTKNALIVRDLPILSRMAQEGLVHVYVSITTLDPELARDMEPRTSIPSARLRAIEMLSDAGVGVGVMAAPIIPGLNDSELPGILRAARNAGASTAGYVLLRLPLSVEPVFAEWLKRTRPELVERVLGRVSATRDGRLNDSQWGRRMVGDGEIAEQIRSLFRVFQRQLGLDTALPPHRCDLFQPPKSRSGQMRLF